MCESHSILASKLHCASRRLPQHVTTSRSYVLVEARHCKDPREAHRLQVLAISVVLLRPSASLSIVSNVVQAQVSSHVCMAVLWVRIIAAAWVEAMGWRVRAVHLYNGGKAMIAQDPQSLPRTDLHVIDDHWRTELCQVAHVPQVEHRAGEGVIAVDEDHVARWTVWKVGNILKICVPGSLVAGRAAHGTELRVPSAHCLTGVALVKMDPITKSCLYELHH